MGPGSNPSWHEHSNPPTTLVQFPFPHGFPMEHSSVSEEESASSSNALRNVDSFVLPLSVVPFY